jgi:EmrB/QacA subfamily drug resistance transporter
VAEPAKASRVNPWWVLAGACTGLFVLMLDSTVVVLALPAIHADLGASLDGLQWVQNAYLLTLAATVVSAGRLGDILGRRRVFLAGMAGFAIGSIVSGSANDEAVLVAGRVIQGLGGSALLALSLALTTDVFDRAALPRALGIWAAVSAVALALGPLVGGALIEAASWRWIFFINVPVAVLGSAILLTRGRESRDPSASRVDLAGVAVLAVGLTAIVFALVQADEWGWGSVRTLGLLAGGCAVLVGFWRLEHRLDAPLVDFSLFRNGPYLGATAAAFALVGAYWSVMFFQPQYLQDVRGHSAVLSGLMIMPVTVPMIFISPFSGRLIARFGARGLMTLGMTLGTLGLIALTQIDAGSSYALLLAGYLPFGVALGLVYAPMSTAAMAAMPADKVGIASGVLAMDRVMAGTVALAVTGAVFHALLGDDGSFADSVAGSTWVLVVLCAAGAALTWAFVRDPERPGPDPAVAGEPRLQDLHHHRHHKRFHL